MSEEYYCVALQERIHNVIASGFIYTVLFLFRYTYCYRCFNDIQGDSITMGEDPSQPAL